MLPSVNKTKVVHSLGWAVWWRSNLFDSYLKRIKIYTLYQTTQKGYHTDSNKPPMHHCQNHHQILPMSPSRTVYIYKKIGMCTELEKAY